MGMGLFWKNLLKRKTVLPYFNKTSHLHSKHNEKNQEIIKIRNLGILAHIDAGKTTTTERMLYYSGLINQPGEVHHGNTVTDYMEQERERGITIRSAAITFQWKKHQFNLIDTPGHIDFTMEVEQTLNVLDGAIVILDGSAGVEAQTLTVWRQAERYDIPRLFFINKMDRSDSSHTLCCKSIEKKLETPTLCLQLPIRENQKFAGVVDLLKMEQITYGSSKQPQCSPVPVNTKLWEEAKLARTQMIDILSNYSDELANIIIAKESLDDLQTSDIMKALREVTLSHKAIPVLIGSAYKNMGIQSLMDAVILYLPSPIERNQRFSIFDSEFCARAFKVIHDKQKGPLVFFRVYSGTFNKGQRIYNINLDITEQSGKLYVASADDFKEVDKIQNGNIAVVAGLKQTVSGNLITSSMTALQKVQKKFKPRKKDVPESFLDSLGVSAKVPEPVFFCSIEPPSLAYQSGMEQALYELQREDPSLRVSFNTETGQTILAGMGELHLEIIRDRIFKEYKIDVELGPLQIAYREAPVDKVTDSIQIETRIGNSKQSVNLKLSVIPVQSSGFTDVMRLDKTPEASSNIASLYPRHLLAVKQGIDVGISRGPKTNSQVVDVEVMLHLLLVGKGTSETFIAATTTQLVQKLLKMSGTYVLEPVMHLEITVPEEYLSTVMSDLSRRRSSIKNISLRRNMKVVEVNAPLSELMGYSTALRTITSGTGTFSIEFNEYQKMNLSEEEKAIQATRGF